jgi:hypothetical protein
MDLKSVRSFLPFRELDVGGRGTIPVPKRLHAAAVSTVKTWALMLVHSRKVRPVLEVR